MKNQKVEDLNKALNDLNSRVALLRQALSLREDKERELKGFLSSLTAEAELVGKSEIVLQNISAKVLGQSISIIDNMVTSGLKVVFDDQKLDFRTDVRRYRGKTSVNFELFHEGKTAPLLDSFGGGVLCVVGVLLRVVVIIVLNERRTLFLDESLAHLSENYHANASFLMKKLCKDLGFNILMVTQAESFVQHADLHYHGTSKGSYVEFEQKS